MKKTNYAIAFIVMLMTVALYSFANANASQTKSNAASTTKTSITDDGWQDVSSEEALAFIEEFYTHAPEQGSSEWDEQVLKRYLAPNVLQTLRDSVKNAYDKDTSAKYATWLLTCIDNSEMIYLSKDNQPAYKDDNGRYVKDFKIFYWADPVLSYVQELYFTVKKKGGKLFITQIDGLGNEGPDAVWNMQAERSRWQQVEIKAQEFGGIENLTEAQLDSLYEHAFDE